MEFQVRFLTTINVVAKDREEAIGKARDILMTPGTTTVIVTTSPIVNGQVEYLSGSEVGTIRF